MIEKTKAFKKMDSIQRHIASTAKNKKTIHYHLQLLQNVGMNRWKELNGALPAHWRDIVIELNEKSCNHPEEARVIKAVETIVNCETTVIMCGICRKYLTEPETDCR